MKNNIISSLPYRRNVSCILFCENKYLVVQLGEWKKTYWKFPQGGIEIKESEKQAIKRELLEELNITNIEIVRKCKQTNLYNWPERIIKKVRYKWQGQNQVFYLVKYLANRDEINKSKDSEVKRFKWVTKSELFKLIDHEEEIIFKGYKKVIKDIFKEYVKILS